jgi:hypothetical protein
MIAMQNIIDTDKSLLTILFDRSVMKHLKCKPDDYLCVLQSNFKPTYFMLVKADSGYRVRRYPNLKKVYQVNVDYQFKYIPEFDLNECSYFLKKNGAVRIVLKV